MHRVFNDNAFEVVDKDDPRNAIGRYNRADMRIYKQIFVAKRNLIYHKIIHDLIVKLVRN